MPIDPRIFLGAKPPNIMGPVDIFGIQDMVRRNQLSELELQEAQQKAQGRNMFSQLARDPSSFGPTGNLTPDAFRQFAAADPGGALAMRNYLLQEEERRSLINLHLSQQKEVEERANKEQYENASRRILPAWRSTMSKYNDLVKAGVGIDEASKQAQAFYDEQVEDLTKSGDLVKPYDAKAKMKFNPYVFQEHIARVSQILGKGAGYEERTVPQKGDMVQKQFRDSPASPWQDLGSPTHKFAKQIADPSGGSAGGLPKGVTEYIDTKTNKNYARGKGLAYELVDGKWVKTTADKLPAKLTKVGSTAAGQGAREAVFTQRKIGAANQAFGDLGNIVMLPIDTDRGAFQFGQVHAPSFLDASKVVLGNKITPESGQVYNRMATGLQRSLATIESQGLMPSGSLTHQMDAVLWKPGDTTLSKLHALAQIRQIIDKQMEVELHNPRVSEDEKDLVRQIVEGAHEAVPFTHKDLIDLTNTQKKNPSATLRDIIKKKGGAAGKPQAEGSVKKNYSRYWSTPAPAKARPKGSAGPAQALTEQAEDPDEDSDKDNE